MPRSLTAVTGALVASGLAALLTGCMAGSTDPGCGECVEELAQVRKEIESLPDVKRLLTLKKYAASPTNGAGVKIELRSRSTGDDQVVQEVAGIVWKSELTPVDVVDVTVEDASGELVHGGSPYDFRDGSRDHPSFEELWGPRPVEE